MKIDIREILKQVERNEMSRFEAFELIEKVRQEGGKKKRLEDIDLASKSIFSRTFDFDELYLRDHTVFNKPVLLGVTHCSLAIEAAYSFYARKSLNHIHKLLFLEPVVLEPSEMVDINVFIEENEGRSFFTNKYVKTSEQVSYDTASGEYLFEPLTEPAAVVVGDFFSHNDMIIESGGIYGNEVSVKHGPSLHSVKKIYVRGNERLGEISLTDEIIKSGYNYEIHPAFLDAAIVSATSALPDISGSFIPFMIKDICIFGKPDNACFSYSRIVKTNQELIVADIMLCGMNGQVLVSLEGFTCKHVSSLESFERRTKPGLSSSASEILRIPFDKSKNLESNIQSYLAKKVEALLDGSGKKFDPRKNFIDMGIDSNKLVALSRGIEKELGVELYPTLFFEYQDIKELSAYFASEYKNEFEGLAGGGELSEGPEAVTVPIPNESLPVREFKADSSPAGDIAVVGMAGRFADSPDLAAFWNNLVEEKDLIKEIPPNHFDFKPWFNPNRDASDRMYCKWGSFIDDVDMFDARFFNISPREAEVMDPQLRLLLEVLYSTAEDAGYPHKIRGSKTGMYVGVCFHDYQQEMDRLGKPVAPHDGSGNAATMLANRPSFYFNLKGPSLSVDTACSSSLVALHLACNALKNNECRTAFVAGVNLLLSSWHYRYFCSIGALSPSGRCFTFDKRADGYVPGEGIAAVLLKPLESALRDNDRIHAVIKGSAVNHGGYTPSVTAPSVKLEAEVILDAWKNAGIDPGSIGYIEAHGTGTELGDPVEINALNRAFKQYSGNEPFCAVGSAKAHIGHTEGAAGITGVIKAILSMKHKKIPAMPSFSELNPFIELKDSPLFINHDIIDWNTIDSLPRRAGVSSFGFGGTYAHVVLEEVQCFGSAQHRGSGEELEWLIVLSARNEESLKGYARSFAGFLDSVDPGLLPRIAYTLLVGREVMEVRLAVVVSGVDELREKLTLFCDSAGDVENIFFANTENENEKPGVVVKAEEDSEFLQKVFDDREMDQLALLWVWSTDVDRELFYPGVARQVISLPGYSFARQSYWISESVPQSHKQQAVPSKLHPFIDFNSSTLIEQKFTTRFSGEEFYLADHLVGKLKVLPAVVSIEMARKAGELAGEKNVVKLKNIVWPRSIIWDENFQEVYTCLNPEKDGIGYEVILVGENNERVTYNQGKLIYWDDSAEEAEKEIVDIDAIKKRCPDTMHGEECYSLLKSLGLNLGPGFQVLQEVYSNEIEALSYLMIPEHLKEGFSEFALHPSLMDGALHTIMGFIGKDLESLHIPFAMNEVEILKPLSDVCYAYATVLKSNNGINFDVLKFDIKIMNDAGEVLVKIKNFLPRPFSHKIETAPVNAESKKAEVIYYRSNWVDFELDNTPVKDEFPYYILIFDTDDSLLNALNNAAFKNYEAKESQFILVKPGALYKELAENIYEINPVDYSDYEQLFETIKNKSLIPSKIIHLWSKELLYDKKSLKSDLERGFYSVFSLSKALIELDLKNSIQVLYMYLYHYSNPQPQYAAVSGFAKSIMKESSRVAYKTIGINILAGEEPAGTTSRILDLALKEFQAKDNTGIDIRYEKEARQIKLLEKFDPDSYTKKNSNLKKQLELRESGVYLLTGGTGGLGLIFAEYLAKEFKARLILVGRSELTPGIKSKIEKIESFGSELLYIKADISNREDVKRVILESKSRFSNINGIIHGAGVIRDAYLLKKNKKDIDEVLLPKVFGTLNLDEAAKEENLDFFIMFSSISAVIGNSGQSDYAFASCFMDYFADKRETLRQIGERNGKTVSINWPLWQEGGMKTDKQTAIMLEEGFGLKLLDTETGINAFIKGLHITANQFGIVKGDTQKMRRIRGLEKVFDMKSSSGEARDSKKIISSLPDSSSGEEYLLRMVQKDVIRIASLVLKTDESGILPGGDMSEFGFDSINLTDFANKINKLFCIEITPAILFEYKTITSITHFLLMEFKESFIQYYQEDLAEETHNDKLEWDNLSYENQITKSRFQEKIEKANEFENESIAIIGMSARMPGSENLEIFWKNLETGKNLITEIPSGRWNWKACYGQPAKEINKTNSKWGGFIENIDAFDPLFFNISPKESTFMDPQQRILLETVWHTIEDAGYRPLSLSGSKTGLFIGVSSSDYYSILKEMNSEIEAYTSTGAAHSILVNRVSYVLDIHGPSEPIDTACSSSLVAIHRAVIALRLGDCELAIAGGVNALLSPELFISFSKAGMLSPDGVCKTFDKGANGYVRGEGVGAIFLKPLSLAIEDHDHIYAVIKGAAVNHGGHTNSLTVPNPNAQSDLIVSTYMKAGISPDSITYIETHGTGTELGDPIEINALKKAFSELFELFKKEQDRKDYCGLGAVKTNIGHLEAAAGIAGVLKVLLAMKYKTIPATIHFKEINPYIDLKDSPFYIVKENQQWEHLFDKYNNEIPRRAGVSSFGFGGVNAHIILEEYQDRSFVCKDYEEDISEIFLLSAKNENCLNEYIQIVKEYIQSHYEEINLKDIVYTLQVGRDEFNYRLAVVVNSKDGLIQKLESYLDDEKNVENLFLGNHRSVTKKTAIELNNPDKQYVRQLFDEKKINEIAALWVEGAEIDWNELYNENDRRRISFPGYPFIRQKYWFNKIVGKTDSFNTIRNNIKTLHPLIDSNESTFEKECFKKVFTGDEFYLRDHIVKTEKVLPGVAYLEMARVAGDLANKQSQVKRLSNIVWAKPILFSGIPLEAYICLYPNQGSVHYEVISITKENKNVTHSQGKIIFEDTIENISELIDIKNIKQRCLSKKNGEDCYQLFQKKGLIYGPSFQTIQELYYNEKEALSRLVLHPENVGDSYEFDFHPALMDGALQTVMGLMSNTQKDDSRVYLPFTLGQIDFLRPLPETCYVYAVLLENQPGSESEIRRFNILLIDEASNLLVRMNEFSARAFSPEKEIVIKEEAPQMMFFQRVWGKSNVETGRPDDVLNDFESEVKQSSAELSGNILIFDIDLDFSYTLKKYISNEKDADASVVSVIKGKEFKEIKTNLYEINPKNQEDYQKLLSILEKENLIPSKIIHTWSQRTIFIGIKNLKEQLEEGFYSLFYLSQALLRYIPKRSVQLLYFYSDYEDLEKPHCAALSAFAKTVHLENPGFFYKIITLQPPQKENPINTTSRMLDIVLNEFNSANGLDIEVYYKGDERYLKYFKEFELADDAQQQIELKENGVYLITGGTGGLGLIFAEFLTGKVKAKVILIGRSDLSIQQKRKMRLIKSLGSEVVLFKADISNRKHMKAVIAKVKSRFKKINGIIHCAGVNRDSIILKKTIHELEEVLAPKVYGLLYLDDILKDESFDFVVLFSSITAITGNPGQSDYAFANSFMDNFAKMRNNLCKKGERQGKTLSINWPLWSEGGMKVDEQTEIMLARSMGMNVLEAKEGLSIFIRGLSFAESQFIVIKGARRKIERFLGLEEKNSKRDATRQEINIDKREFFRKIENDLVKVVSAILEVDENDIDIDEDMSEYGFDSISLTEFTNEINEKYKLDITPAIFFEQPSISAFSEYLYEEYKYSLIKYYEVDFVESKSNQSSEIFDEVSKYDGLDNRFQRWNENKQEDDTKFYEKNELIAIIGMCGVMPGSENLEIFWRNLEEGKNLVREIPQSRLSLKNYYDNSSEALNVNSTKWGGFINNVDKFDPGFFSISPREAVLMDPQQRIYLEIIWKTIEDAGYKIADLSGTNTGLFVGVATADYNDLLKDNDVDVDAYTSTGLSHAILANRISYIINISGPSEPINTACSSSLLAVNRAVESIRNKKCDLALAGGVNLMLSPTLFISFGKAGMLSEDGRCKTFDARANGYVRGEGAGAILLKALDKAEKDGDHIYGVIKGIAVNHGGHVNTLTTPNPNAQAEVIINAFKDAGIDPSTITYIEAHGTGTSLGDPAEINGLKKAFSELFKRNGKPLSVKPYCGIGSVKTNIGHLEAAAGIAGIFKVLLSIKNKKLPGNIHFKELNPYIRLEESPFYIIKETESWESLKDNENKIIPRRAGISSFGFGGVNAHVVIEEYVNSFRQTDQQMEKTVLFVLSAANSERLKVYAHRFIDFLDKHELSKDTLALKITLDAIAYTSQIGRDPMEERMALIVSHIKELKERLTQYCNGEKDVNNLYLGNIKQSKIDSKLLLGGRAGEEFLKTVIVDKDYLRLAKLWVSGVEIEWRLLYGEQFPGRITLPTYPFAQERYWISSTSSKSIRSDAYIKILPLVDKIDLKLSIKNGMVFLKSLQRKDLILKDHEVKGELILPGVAFLEMAYSAFSKINDISKYNIEKMAWLQPLVVTEEKKEVRIYIKEENNQLQFKIKSGKNNNLIVHAKGEFKNKVSLEEDNQHISIDRIKSNWTQRVSGDTIYSEFKKVGIRYGSYFQVLEEILINDKEALGVLNMPREYQNELKSYNLHPSLMDGILQTISGIILNHEKKNYRLMLPFSLEKIEIIKSPTIQSFAYVNTIGKNRYNIALLDNNGMVCIKLYDVSLREMKESLRRFFYIPGWMAVPFDSSGKSITISDDREENPNKSIVIIYPKQAYHLNKTIVENHSRDEIIEIELGMKTVKHSETKWIIKTDDPFALDNCFKEIKDIGIVYFLGGIIDGDIDVNNLDELERIQERGLFSLFRIIKSLSQHNFIHQYLQLKVITNDVYQIVREGKNKPYSASLSGLSKSIAKEYPNISISCIDISIEPDSTKVDIRNMVKIIIDEPANSNGNEVLIRNGKRYVRTITPLLLQPVHRLPFKRHGVYFIIGGAGGIGLAFGKYLAEISKARLVLIGRSELNKDQKNKISEIESKGGRVLYEQADITNIESMEKVLEKAKSFFGKIDGVIHSAIVLEDKSIEKMDEETLKLVIAPKVKGSLVLAKLFREESLDFLIFFSSVQSFIGSPGQANYVAACSFKDAFALYLNQELSYPVKIINWGYWGNVGAVASEEYNKRIIEQGIESIDSAEGMEAIKRVVDNDIEQVISFKAKDYVLHKIGVELDKRVEVYKKTIPSVIEKLSDNCGILDSATIDLSEFNNCFAEIEKFGQFLLLAEFNKIGVFSLAGDIFDKEQVKNLLSIIPRYYQLFDSLLDILAFAGFIKVDNMQIVSLPMVDDEHVKNELMSLENKRVFLIKKFPEIEAYINLLWICVSNFHEILKGNIPATEIIFPASSMKLVERIYKGNAVADYYNNMIVHDIREYIKIRLSMNEKCLIKILEIGAGTGGTSFLLFNGIKEYGKNLQYFYTDVSQAFIQYGKKEYNPDYPFTDYKVLDIEKDIREQGFVYGDFDLVIAANVLHAAKNLRNSLRNVKALLKHSGCLVLNELTSIQSFTTLTFGLLDGWWNYEDEEERLKGAPLLNLEMWKRVLREEGFDRIITQGSSILGKDRFSQNIIIAESNGVSKLPVLNQNDIIKMNKVDNVRIYQSMSTVDSKEEDRFNSPVTGEEDLIRFIKVKVLNIIASTLSMNIEDIDQEKPFSDYGVDSINGIELINKINETFKIDLRTTIFFDYTNIIDLSGYIFNHYRSEVIKKSRIQYDDISLGKNSKNIEIHKMYQSDPKNKSLQKENDFLLDLKSYEAKKQVGQNIAIIGISGRFPGAKNINEFWQNLSEGISSIVEVPEKRWNIEEYYDPDPQNLRKTYCKWGGFLEDIDMFDPLFFNISGKEAELTDPQQRLFLEECWNAFEDAGYAKEKISNTKCGVFVGVTTSDYLNKMHEEGVEKHAQSFWGNASSIVAARISYFFNLKGPSISIDTACSSSLVAVHYAVQSILNNESEFAIAGGVFICTTPEFFVLSSNAGMLSPEGRCKTFDQSADGFVPGEGVGVVVLKPLESALRDNDNIYAIIKGSGTNQDGKTNGITAPSTISQMKLEADIYKKFGINPETISYVEAHGTGTKLGDPIEIDALTNSFRKYTDKKQYCAIGSVKTNIGHAVTAAGIASILKVVLAFKNKKIFPSLNYIKENEHLNLKESPFYVNTTLIDWKVEKDIPRRAAISSFGIGGSNAHMVLEEMPSNSNQEFSFGNFYSIIPFSAKTELSLTHKIEDIAQWLEQEDKHSIDNLAYMLQVGRTHFSYRSGFIVRGVDDLKQKLKMFLKGEVVEDCLISSQEESILISESSSNEELENLLKELRSTDLLSKSGYKEKLLVLADLYIKGHHINWEALWLDRNYYRIPLPSYPFDRDRYWIKRVPNKKLYIPSSQNIPSIVDNISCRIEPLQDEMIIARAFREIEHFGQYLLLNAFRKMGVFNHKNENYDKLVLREQLNIEPRYYPLYDALLVMLASSGFIQIEHHSITTFSLVEKEEFKNDSVSLNEKKDYLLESYSVLAAYINLIWICLIDYPAILTGKTLATDIIFPNSSMELVEKIYKENSFADYFNHQVVHAIRSYIDFILPRLEKGKKIRILEIGAGTGGTSSFVFKAIDEYKENIEYYYTDISSAFLIYGKEEYGLSFPSIKFQRLNIEKDPKEQGFKTGDFDILIGSNVLHATKRIRNTLRNAKILLKTNGWLVINEMTKIQNFATLTFGLLEGWWAFEDEENRVERAPLLTLSMWKRLLSEEGYDRVIVLGSESTKQDNLPQHVLIAESNGTLIENQERSHDKQFSKEISSLTNQRKEIKYNRKEENNEIIKDKIIESLSEVLRIENSKFGFNDSYLDFGIDSILAINIINKINEKLAIDLKTVDLFNYSTISELTSYIAGEFYHNIGCDDGAMDRKKKNSTPKSDFHKQKIISVEADRLLEDSISIIDISPKENIINTLYNYKINSKKRGGEFITGKNILNEYLDLIMKLDKKMVNLLVKTSSNIKMEVVMSGSGIPILLIPGLGMTAPIWLYQFKDWSSQYKLIVVHKPGHGLSERSDDVSPDAISTEIIELLNELDIKCPIHVIGTSYGGIVAQAFVEKNKDRILSLTLSNSFYQGNPEMLKSMSVENILEILAKRTKNDMDNVVKNTNSKRIKKKYDSYYNLIMKSNYIDPIMAFKYVDELIKLTAVDLLKQIEIPTLILSGKLDVFASYDLQVLKSKFRNFQYFEISDAGHYPYITHNRKFNKRVMDFIQEQEAKTTKNLG
ncbi:MAG: SDR family NAD(P)-dependent oxidoreductase [bacterium]|nr:SDR family NAD(P)-dependent oxidoreductase [bacterium]